MNSQEHPIVIEAPKTLIAKRFEEVYGVTVRAVEGKINRKTWTEGVEYLRDPDGKIHVIIEGYDKWLYKNTPKPLALASVSKADQSSLISDGKESDSAQPPSSSQPKKVSRLLPRFDAKL